MNARQAISLVLLIASYAVSGCASMLESPFDKLERKMMFHPLKLRKDEPTPEGVESVWIDGESYERRRWLSTVPDVQKLHGVLAEAPGPTPPRAVMLYCHGNAGCVDGRAEQIRNTADKFGVTILAFDYRGFGRSDGTPDAEGIVADARSARRWLADRTRTAETDVVLMGESLGGAVAVELAAHDGARGLVLLSTFSSLGDIAEELAPAMLRPRQMVGDKLDSLASIKRYEGPLLQRHGDADRVIPFSQGERLFAAAPGPKQFIAVKDGGHDCPGTPEFYEAFENFIRFLPSGDAPGVALLKNQHNESPGATENASLR